MALNELRRDAELPACVELLFLQVSLFRRNETSCSIGDCFRPYRLCVRFGLEKIEPIDGKGTRVRAKLSLISVCDDDKTNSSEKS